MKIEYQDRIEKYLQNRMSDTDRLTFEQDLEKDVELREQYEFVSLVKTSLMLENIDKDVNKWSKAYKEREEQERVAVSYRPIGTDYRYYAPGRPIDLHVMLRSLGRKILYWVTGIAAVLIVGVFVFKQYSILYSPSSTEIAKETTYYPNYSPLNKDGNISFKERSQMDIESHIAEGDYSKTLAQIEKDEAEIKQDLMRLERDIYSRGESYENTDEKHDSLENKLSQLFYWKAKALIGLDRKDEAVILLDEIRHSESNYKKQADSLYKVLKK